MIAVGMGPGRAVAAATANHSGVQPVAADCRAPIISTGARTCTYTFRFTGNVETFVVPPTTAPVEITAVGAPGAGPPDLRSRGATVTGSFSSLSGVPLFITVGGDGWHDSFNGGGPGGGGATDVRLGSPDLDHRIIVAGGGGGWGQQLIFDEVGSHRLVAVKGGDAGQPGLGSGGQPGTTTAGGSGGGNEYGPGQAGAFGRGGAGWEGNSGGGGGYYGGGGGGGCAGSDDKGSLCLDSQPGSGGGGSSLLPPGGTFVLRNDLTPSVTITTTQYGWWKLP
jgi:hypothetical protein